MNIAELAYNNNVHAATGITPFYADTERHFNVTMTSEIPEAPLDQAEITAYVNQLEEISQFCRAQIFKARVNMIKYYDKHRQIMKFEDGDKI